MKRSLPFGSEVPLIALCLGKSVALPGFLLLFVWLMSSCSPRISGATAIYPPIIRATATSQKYNMQLDIMKHHFSGMLIVRKLPDKEIRILASTYFGLSLFDFSLQGDSFRINSCIAPMQKEKVLKLFETDFRNLLLPVTHCRIKAKSPLQEKRISGKGFSKSVFTLSEYADDMPEKVQIKHPWIRLTIQLDKLQ